MSQTFNNSQIRQRIDTKANWESNNPTLASGELALVTGMNPSDATNMDFKIGDGSSAFNSSNLPYVIANNKEVKSAKSTANSAASAASSAASAAGTAQTNASNALNRIMQMLLENYETAGTMFSENLTAQFTSVTKKAALQEWAKFALDRTQPRYRVTDGVSFDALFIFLGALASAGIITIDATKMEAFMTALEQGFSAYNNAARTKNRTELDNIRNSYLRS